MVNGILRAYGREAEHRDPWQLPGDPVERLGVRHSFPDWIVKIWLERLGAEQSNRLLAHFNETPKIDLRVNTRQQQIDIFYD